MSARPAFRSYSAPASLPFTRAPVAVLLSLALVLTLIPSASAEVDSDTLGSAPGRFNSIIEKDREIPTEAPLAETRQYGTQRDNQTDIRIAVYQADREVEYVSDEGAECIGEFYLSGIPPKPKAQEKVDVTFEIDQQNLLHVRAKSSTSEGELEIERQ